MASFLTPAGLDVPTLQEIIDQQEGILWTVFGNSLNLLPSSVGGQLVSVYANENAQVWQDVQNVYNNWNPAMAGGVSLDNVVSVNGIRRLPATAGTGNLTIYGTIATVIPDGGMTASVAGNPAAQFQNTAAGVIGAGTNCVQTITFSATPASGQWTLVYNGNQTSLLNFNASGVTVAAALNALSGLSGVTVTGPTTNVYTVTFAGASGAQPQPTLSVGTNTVLTAGSAPVAITPLITVPGVLPNVTLPVVCLTTGEIPAYAGTLTTIVTPIVGVSSVNNLTDITPGADIETDSALRIRRYLSVSFPGSANPDAILSKVRQLTGVVSAIIDNNVTFITNGNGTPGKAFQVIALGGDDNEIGQVIWDNGPAGIESFGSTTVVINDISGNPQNVSFSRPTPVPIYVTVNFTELDDFPPGGIATMQQAIVDFAEADFTVGENVIAWRLNLALAGINGIDNLQFRLGTTLTAQVNTLVFGGGSPNLVTGNIINGTVNGVAITPVPFVTNNDTTLTNLAAEIASQLNIASAISDGVHTITITADAGYPFTLAGFAVTGGATQPTVTNNAITPAAPSADVDIPIMATQISTWDTSRIFVIEG